MAGVRGPEFKYLAEELQKGSVLLENESNENVCVSNGFNVEYYVLC